MIKEAVLETAPRSWIFNSSIKERSDEFIQLERQRVLREKEKTEKAKIKAEQSAEKATVAWRDKACQRPISLSRDRYQQIDDAMTFFFEERRDNPIKLDHHLNDICINSPFNASISVVEMEIFNLCVLTAVEDLAELRCSKEKWNEWINKGITLGYADPEASYLRYRKTSWSKVFENLARRDFIKSDVLGLSQDVKKISKDLEQNFFSPEEFIETFVNRLVHSEALLFTRKKSGWRPPRDGGVMVRPTAFRCLLPHLHNGPLSRTVAQIKT